MQSAGVQGLLCARLHVFVHISRDGSHRLGGREERASPVGFRSCRISVGRCTWERVISGPLLVRLSVRFPTSCNLPQLLCHLCEWVFLVNETSCHSK